MNKYAIWYYCNKCCHRVYIKPNSDRHNEIIDYISKYKKNWVHNDCETGDME
jgi:hypothetical protein